MLNDVISANDEGGVHITGGDYNAVSGCLIGTSSDGTQPLGNVGDGVLLDGGTRINRIGLSSDTPIAAEANVICANLSNGVNITEATGNFVAGNFIGTNGVGAANLGNKLDGVLMIDATGNYIGINQQTGGGPGASQKNEIAGNLTNGIEISGGSGNNVAGNFVGVFSVSIFQYKLPNLHDGISISNGSSGNIIGSNGVSNDNWRMNVISGNGWRGIAIGDANIATNGNFVAGNYIGTSGSGNNNIGNTQSGVYIFGKASSNFIGTYSYLGSNPSAAQRNVIAGNGGDGVTISGSDATQNIVAGNYIGAMPGATPNGDVKLPNYGNGVSILNGMPIRTLLVLWARPPPPTSSGRPM